MILICGPCKMGLCLAGAGGCRNAVWHYDTCQELPSPLLATDLVSYLHLEHINSEPFPIPNYLVRSGGQRGSQSAFPFGPQFTMFACVYNLGNLAEIPLLPLPQWQVLIQSKSSPQVQTLPTFLAGTRLLRPMVTTTGRSAKTKGRRRKVTRSSLTLSGRPPYSKEKASSCLTLRKWYVFLFPGAHDDDRPTFDLKKDGFIDLAVNPKSVDDRKDAVS